LPFPEIIPISALKGDNLDLLENLIYDYLPQAEKIYSDEEITDQSERFLLSEIIREKILNWWKKSCHNTTAVVIARLSGRRRRQFSGRRREFESQFFSRPASDQNQSRYPG
jgi:GTP-binding protein Era